MVRGAFQVSLYPLSYQSIPAGKTITETMQYQETGRIVVAWRSCGGAHFIPGGE
jgi:hypothetical protein